MEKMISWIGYRTMPTHSTFSPKVNSMQLGRSPDLAL